MTHHSTLLSRAVLPDEIDQDPKPYSPLLVEFVQLFAALAKANKVDEAVCLVAASHDQIGELITHACVDVGAVTEEEVIL